MAEHSIKIEDGKGRDIAYVSENNHSVEANRENAMKAFNQDVEHGFATGPGTIVGHSSVDRSVIS